MKEEVCDGCLHGLIQMEEESADFCGVPAAAVTAAAATVTSTAPC
jgi:hypothetical protein